MDTSTVDPSKWEQFRASFELFRDPILCAIIAGGVLGFLSVYVVLRRMVFVSAATTHAAGLGVALAFFAEIHLGFHVNPTLGAIALSLLATLLLMADPSWLKLTRESVLGLAFAFAGGAAVLVGDRIAQEAHDIQGILFGTAVLVTPEQLAHVAIMGALILVIHLWWFRGLTFASFDRIGANVQGLPGADAGCGADALHWHHGGRVGAGARSAARVRLLHPVSHRRAGAGSAAGVDVPAGHDRRVHLGRWRLSLCLLL